MKSLYREYRPLRLSDVIGQNQVIEPLEKSLKQGKIGHAYLFVGPRGCGKTSVARILAHEVNGFEYSLEDNYIDIIEIDGASNRGIDDIRELREKVAIAPTTGKYKVYIIDEVHMLTKEAFNALLKTLEEPPSHVIFIMATTDYYKVPVTITSRAQTFTFKLADAKTMHEHLAQIAKKAKISIDDDALDIIVQRGGGSFRDSLSLLDQISSLSSKTITKDLLIQALGLPRSEDIRALLDSYENGDLSTISNKLQTLLSSGVSADVITEEVIQAVVASPKPELLPLLDNLIEVREPYAVAKLLVALTKTIATMPVNPMNPHTTIESPASSADAQPATQTPEASPTTSTKPINAHPVPPITETAIAAPSKESFDWQSFLAEIQPVNEVIFLQLNKCEYELVAGTLHLYPRTKIVKNILDKPNNKQILIDHAHGSSIIIHEAGKHPDSAKNDTTLDKISDIMGGEVINYEGGNSPF